MAATLATVTSGITTDDLVNLGGRNVWTDGTTFHAHFDDGRRERMLIVNPHPNGAVLDLCRWDHCSGRYVICGCRIVPAHQTLAATTALVAAHLPDWHPHR
jgi:hypothetical protein